MAKILVRYIKIVLEALNWFEANYVVQFILIIIFYANKNVLYCYKCASLMLINVNLFSLMTLLSLHLINYISSSGISKIITFILRYA